MNAVLIEELRSLLLSQSSPLDAAVEGVMIQFTFKEGFYVHPTLWREPKTDLEWSRNNPKKKGAKFIDGQKVSVLQFPQGMEAAGFRLTDAQVWAHNHHNVARFYWHRPSASAVAVPPVGDAPSEFAMVQAYRALSQAFWKVRGYRNELRRPDREGTFGISIDCRIDSEPRPSTEAHADLRVVLNEVRLI